MKRARRFLCAPQRKGAPPNLRPPLQESIEVNIITKDLKVELKRRDKWEHIVLGVSLGGTSTAAPSAIN